MEKKLKIFISAYACEPGKGSEPGIGWNVVNELAKYHDVHVLTRANNRGTIEAALAGKEHVPTFHYYDLPKQLVFWKKKRRGYRQYYYLWQYGAFFRYRRWINASHFDIVQHLTFANYAIPSLFMMCKGCTVYGPIGTTRIPKAIFSALPFSVKFKERLRQWSIFLMTHLEPFRVLTPLLADRIIESGTASGKSFFPRRSAAKVVRHPQTGINTSEPEYRTERKRSADGKVRLLICSEFLHWKGVSFSVELFSRIVRKRENVELLIYGSGPEERNMRRILKDSSVSSHVTFKGFVGKDVMIQSLFDADILLYPSYHHGLATVILQAMYAKLPIVALQGDPVGLAVAEGAGVAVTGETMTEIMEHLEQETLRLIDSPELRRQYGEAGRRLIETRYEWRVLCARLSDLLLEFAR